MSGTSHTVQGTKAGRCRQALIGDGTVAAVEAPTAEGVKDTVRGVSGGLAFTGDGPSRTVTLDVAQAERSATISTRTFGGGEDLARLDGRKLVFRHDGEPTTFSFALRSTKQGGPETFESGPLRVASGDSVTAVPASVRVRLTIRDKAGKVRMRDLRNARKAPAKLAITRLRVRGGKSHATVRISGLSGRGAGAVVLRAGRARKVFTIAQAENGTQSFTWRLTRKAKKVAAQMMLVSGGTTVRRTRTVKP